MQTSENIQKEIDALKLVKPDIPEYASMGSSNWEAIDAQILVLSQNFYEDQVQEKFDYDPHVQEAALEAFYWRNHTSPAQDWEAFALARRNNY